MVRDARRAARLAALAALALAAGGCAEEKSSSGEGGGGGKLRFAKPPKVVTPPELPNDRLLVGRLQNQSLREVKLDAARARLLDADGKEVRGTVRFIGSFGHGLYSPRRRPQEADPDFERKRLGELAEVRPGKTTPVTLSWRLRRGAPRPVRLEVDALSVPLPAR